MAWGWHLFFVMSKGYFSVTPQFSIRGLFNSIIRSYYVRPRAAKFDDGFLAATSPTGYSNGHPQLATGMRVCKPCRVVTATWRLSHSVQTAACLHLRLGECKSRSGLWRPAASLRRLRCVMIPTLLRFGLHFRLTAATSQRSAGTIGLQQDTALLQKSRCFPSEEVLSFGMWRRAS